MDKSLTKTTQEIIDWATRTQQKHPGEFKCSGRVGSSCCITGKRLVNLLSNSANCSITRYIFQYVDI
jgi:hypothetical protein